VFAVMVGFATKLVLADDMLSRLGLLNLSVTFRYSCY